MVLVLLLKYLALILNSKLKIKNFRRAAGFTIIEVVFVLALFLIIIGITLSIFIAIIQHQKRILREQELLNQASFGLEYVAKALRMAQKDSDGSCLGTIGYVYTLTHCPNGTLEACNGIKFVNQSDSNACQEFFLDYTDPLNPVLKEIKNGQPAQNILSDALTIKYAKFVLNGDQVLHVASLQDLFQPRVTLLLDIKTKESQDPQEKIMQTTVSLRNLNLP